MKSGQDNKLSSEVDMNFDSLDIDKESFRKLGHSVIDMIAEYFESIRDVPVFPKRSSADISKLFDEKLPGTGQDPELIIKNWNEKIIPNATHLGSPRYFGFVNGSGTMIGVLADALAASVNMNPGGWKASPSATEIERRTISWLAEMIGYPTDCGGLFQSGGTMADFTAILTAFRNKAASDTTAEGLHSSSKSGRYKIYMSDHEGHIAIVRSADMLNLGRNAIRRVKSKDDFTMDTDELKNMIDEDIKNGDIPFCVVAQVGSINVGAVDPLEDIAEICAQRNLWFHADGACGAFGAALPEKQYLFKGLEKADSVTLDPHKWMYIPYECGCVLVKDAEKLRRTFSITAPYLRGTLPTEYTGLDYLEYGPQMSRDFRALKVWMSLKHYGVEGYRQLWRQNIKCAEYLDKLVRESQDFEAFHKPLLFIYSFRYFPQKYRSEGKNISNTSRTLNECLDQLNQHIAEEIQASGVAFIMTSRIHGNLVLRMSICSHRTTLSDIEIVFRKLKQLGEEIDQRLNLF
jgi:glutamate/tyrosine decarboxylase-like PLP-dependent enzyme